MASSSPCCSSRRARAPTRTRYDAVDAQPLSGLSYYPPKQIDDDGTFAYSPVVLVQNAGLTGAAFFPNPTTGKLTILLPQAPADNALRVRVLDLAGRLVREETLPANGEEHMSALQSGTYTITIGAGSQHVTRRIVKQ